MARTIDTASATRSERPLAGRIFGLFTPHLNRYVTRIAGGRYVPFWSLLRHQGRRSGRRYATPVTASRVPGGFAVPMAFGEEADWYRNIVAGGTAAIRWRGTEYQVGDAAAHEPDSAMFGFPVWQTRLFRALGIRRFVLLRER
jgi:deazaflavin-dependent oxidoreductase (nitroreductase family)